MPYTITINTYAETLPELIDLLRLLDEQGLDDPIVHSLDAAADGHLTFTDFEALAIKARDHKPAAVADDAPYGWNFRHQCIEMLRRSYAVEPGSIFGLVGGLHVQLTSLAPYVEHVAMAATFKATPTSFSTGRGAAAERQGVEMQRRWPDLDLNTTIGWLLDAGSQLANEAQS